MSELTSKHQDNSLELSEELSDELKHIRRMLKERLFVKSPAKKSKWRFVPTEQDGNEQDFQSMLSRVFEDVNKPLEEKNYGNRQISRAFKYFYERLCDLSPEKTLSLLDKLLNTTLVTIEVESHSDAFTLFETINNRGIQLTPIELIKNNLLARVEKVREQNGSDNFEFDMNSANDVWDQIAKRLNNDAKLQERFLRHLYNMFRGSKGIDLENYHKASRSNLIKIYDLLIKRSPEKLLNLLDEQSRIYSAFFNFESALDLWDENAAVSLDNLSHLGAAPGYAFLLWSADIALERDWPVKTVVDEVARLLTKWFFWRNLTDFPATRDLDQMFIRLTNKIFEAGKIDISDFMQEARKELSSDTNMASTSRREESLKGDIYKDKPEITRFVLCSIEEFHQTRETKIDLWAMHQNGKPILSMEHVLPKDGKLEGWIEMLKEHSDQSVKEIRDRCTHKLGNLTLTGYNQNLGQKGFVRKRDQVDKFSNKMTGFKNGLYLNSRLREQEDWNESAINERTDELAKEVMEIFAFE